MRDLLRLTTLREQAKRLKISLGTAAMSTNLSLAELLIKLKNDR